MSIEDCEGCANCDLPGFVTPCCNCIRNPEFKDLKDNFEKEE